MQFLLFLSFLLCGLHRTACLALKSDNCATTCIVSTSKSGGHSRYVFLDEASRRLQNSRTKQSKILDTIGGIKSGIRATFLPSGYPTKTPPGYLRYATWSCIQDVSTQLRGVLATQRVLEGVGVGREGATALSALMNYLVRDAVGMAATLFFTSVASSKFRTDVKRWRLFADLIVDVGITLEVIAVLLPRAFFLPIISIGNMCKAMCGVAAGACGGSINLHWAQGSDISDINAKFGAQSTVTGALGLVFSALFARSVDHVNPWFLWTVYSGLTLLHIYANMKCMRLIAFDSLSSTRMNAILAEFMQWWKSKEGEESAPQLPPGPKLSCPAALARTEPLFFGTGWLQKRPMHRARIYFGVDYNKFLTMSKKSANDFNQEDFQDNNAKYVITSGWERNGRTPCVLVSLFTDITPREETKAYFHATLLALQLEKNRSDYIDQDLLSSSEEKVQSYADRAWLIFESACQERGWDLDKTELQSYGYEIKYISDVIS